MTDYAKWDNFADSDEDKPKDARPKGPPAAPPGMPPKRPAGGLAGKGGAGSSPQDEMSKQEFLDTYSKVFNPGGKKKAYKFPDTAEEQEPICAAAAELKERGNELYKKGEFFEAAKLYEQGVLKFADWFAEAFATDEERARVYPIKLPCHLNLAACSWRLGNYQHAVTHCTQARRSSEAQPLCPWAHTASC